MGLFTSTSLNQTPDTSQQGTVSQYAQPYVSNMLNKSESLLNAPTPVYKGDLTAGYSDLQNQAWKGLSSLTVPTSLQNAGNNLNDISAKEMALKYDPNTITANQFDATQAAKYMNPYIQASLDPQLAALQRQQQINQQADMAKLAQAGAFGGSRQAILQGQNNENLLRQQNQLIGSGYNQAYQNATQQFNADSARDLQAQQLNQAAKQFGATYGLQGLQAATQAQTAAANAGAQANQYGLANLQAMSTAGNQQQQLDQQALNAQYNEYLRQLKYPQEMLTLNSNIISKLPITTNNTYSAAKSVAQQLAGGISGAAGVIGDLKKMGYTPEKIASYVKSMFTGSNGQPTLTDAQIQQEIDRATAESEAQRQPPSDAQDNGDGTFTRSNNGILETYDDKGNMIGAERDPNYNTDYVDPNANVDTTAPEDLNNFEG
jgi:hypothetical protein